MKIAIIGNSYFATKLVKKFRKTDPCHRYFTAATYESQRDALWYMFNLPTTDIVYSIGGAIGRSRAFSIAQRLGKPVVMHWIGSDVLRAKREYKSGCADLSLVRSAVHLAEVSWIADELRELGVTAEIQPLATLSDYFGRLTPLPDDFSVFSYIGNTDPDFYGLPLVNRLAEEFPAIKFRIAGLETSNRPLSSNVHLLGWCNDMKAEYERAVLFLRLPEHDGLAFSVLEALSSARYVAYSQNFPETFWTPDYASLRACFVNLLKAFECKTLSNNTAGALFVRHAYADEPVVKGLLSRLTDLAYSRL